MRSITADEVATSLVMNARSRAYGRDTGRSRVEHHLDPGELVVNGSCVHQGQVRIIGRQRSYVGERFVELAASEHLPHRFVFKMVRCGSGSHTEIPHSRS